MKSETQKLSEHVQGLFRIECHFCGMVHEDKLEGACSLEAAAQSFLDDGWKEITSHRYNTIAAACPNCVQTVE